MSYVHDKWRERTKKVIMNYMLVSPALLTHTCRVHPIALFPVHFYIENCCHGELCTQYFITLSYNSYFSSLHYEKKNSCVPRNIGRKNFTKFYQNQETTLFFRNDNSRVYTTSTMHLEHF